ncbi:DUF2169 domain-containing protein, partial [Chondromyces apiculatus]|uniref:DUF2169 domain-containing protein n=1 Tax=Chondromyces apiculatus TaxID=51 RepID=UPI0005C613C6
MDVVSACALPVSARVWPTLRSGWTLTVVCKATYLLSPVESTLLPTQEAPTEEDTTWDDDPSRSLSASTDILPFKPRADIVLVGSAYAPGKTPARSFVTRLLVGDLDKSIEVHAGRAWTQDGHLREGPRVTKVPLRYERAAGGPDTWNPVGVRRDAPPDMYGMRPLPDL